MKQKFFVFAVALLSITGCSERTSREIRECAEAAALQAETGREYSKLLDRSDRALGEMHINQAQQAFRIASAWREKACSGKNDTIRYAVGS